MTLFIGACTWVGSGDLECQLQLVDDDGDGYPLNELAGSTSDPDWCDTLIPVDCDDGDPAIHPNAVETWYDSIDADCLADDDFDQDKDGYVPSEWEGEITTGVDGSGGLPGGDCDDGDPAINPAMEDSWYDGVDTDCDQRDDYDQDGDGYVADEHLGLATEGIEGSGNLPGMDCDDLESSINPGEVDEWYDGVDTNCDGRDDYDQDADGFVMDDDVGKVTLYADGSGGLPGGDCNDEAGDVYPGAQDVWYDGVDSDCAQDDDFDQDGDGYQHYAALDGDDCDDLNPDAHPGAVEVLSDSADFDCDGGDDTFFLYELDDLEWSEVSALGFTQNDDEVFLGVSAGQVVYWTTSSTSSTYYDSGLALRMTMADLSAGTQQVMPWLQYLSDDDYPLTDGLDLLADPEALYATVGYLNPDGDRLLTVRRWGLDTSSRNNASPVVGEDTGLWFDDVALDQDPDQSDFHAIGCGVGGGDESLAYVWVTETTLLSYNQYDCAETTAIVGAPCEMDFLSQGGTSTGVVFVNDGDEDAVGNISIYTFEPCVYDAGVDCCPSFTDIADISGYHAATFDLLDPGDGTWMMVLMDQSASMLAVLSVSQDGGFGTTLLDSITYPDYLMAPVVTSAALAPDGTLYVAYVDESDAVGMLYGVPGSYVGLSSVELDADMVAEDVAILATGDGHSALLAVSGQDAFSLEERVMLGLVNTGY